MAAVERQRGRDPYSALAVLSVETGAVLVPSHLSNNKYPLRFARAVERELILRSYWGDFDTAYGETPEARAADRASRGIPAALCSDEAHARYCTRAKGHMPLYCRFAPHPDVRAMRGVTGTYVRVVDAPLCVCGGHDAHDVLLCPYGNVRCSPAHPRAYGALPPPFTVNDVMVATPDAKLAKAPASEPIDLKAKDEDLSDV